ncbi:putative nuclease HARBI1 [Cinnamomum micranthum f. kanehirae]|uniref:Putative nuclease HARBI1 n=1 Tax=Cinnamomum micranthum f. kanehirae TaxID=337451 RepID=A0A443P6S4_9MAGN|nr:putative nuclease HARBI1 [Cinnamomum micranthum f. kanehirae]
MRQSLFLRIVNAVEAYDPYFGVVVDDYVRITKSTSIKSLKRFVEAIVDVFREQHLEKPNIVDIFLDCYKKVRDVGQAPPANYSINGHDYIMEYYLANRIFPLWATFVKTTPCPNGPKAIIFVVTQESSRLNVERAFGLPQASFVIVVGLLMNAMKVFNSITMQERVKVVTLECRATTQQNSMISFETTCAFVTEEHILDSK